MSKKAPSLQHQRGSSLLIVLVLLTVLLLGALSVARVSESSTLVVGNIADKDAALQASEAGVAEGNQAISSLTNFELSQPAWYFASKLTDDASGLPVLPAGSSWAQAPSLTVGKFQVAYVVERYCQLPLPVVNAAQQCSLKAQPAVGSAKSGQETMDAPLAMQYRITVSVTGPKSSQAFVQTLVSL